MPPDGESFKVVHVVPLSEAREVRVRVGVMEGRCVIDTRLFWRIDGKMTASNNGVALESAAAVLELIAGLQAAALKVRA